MYMLCMHMDDFSPICHYIRFVVIKKKGKKQLKMRIYTIRLFKLKMWVSSTIYIDIFWLEKERGPSKYISNAEVLMHSLVNFTYVFVLIYSAGIVVTYTKSQVLIWWLFHTANLFLEVKFPYHARNFKISSRKKYIHLTCFIAGILLPVVPIVIIMADTAVDLQKQNEKSASHQRNNLFLLEGLGFGHLTIPALFCASTNSNATFYSLLIMTDVIVACGCTMLIIVFWSIHKIYIKRKQVQVI